MVATLRALRPRHQPDPGGVRACPQYRHTGIRALVWLPRVRLSGWPTRRMAISRQYARSPLSDMALAACFCGASRSFSPAWSGYMSAGATGMPVGRRKLARRQFARNPKQVSNVRLHPIDRSLRFLVVGRCAPLRTRCRRSSWAWTRNWRFSCELAIRLVAMVERRVLTSSPYQCRSCCRS